MYGFDEETGGSSNNNYLQAGIEENVFLVDVAYEPYKKDNDKDKALRFHFANAAKATFTHTEFPIDIEKLSSLAKGWGKSADEVKAFVQDEFTSQGERVKHILSTFIPKDKCVFKASSFKEFAEGVIELLGDTYKDKPVRIKTIYKGNSTYNTFPRRAIAPFIQLMSEPSKLKINEKYDKVTLPEPTKSEDLFPSTASAEDDAPW